MNIYYLGLPWRTQTWNSILTSFLHSSLLQFCSILGLPPFCYRTVDCTRCVLRESILYLLTRFPICWLDLWLLSRFWICWIDLLLPTRFCSSCFNLLLLTWFCICWLDFFLTLVRFCWFDLLLTTQFCICWFNLVLLTPCCICWLDRAPRATTGLRGP